MLKPEVVESWRRYCWHVCDGWEENFISTESTVTNLPHTLAIEIDNIVEGHFKYRDWTKSGLPYINDGEKFWNGWWFEKRSDAEKALKILEPLSPVASWVSNYREVIDARNAERNGK